MDDNAARTDPGRRAAVATAATPPTERGAITVDRRVARAAAYSWRLLVIAAAAVGVLWLIGQLLVVVIPVVVALLLVRVLMAPTNWMADRGLPRALASAVAVLAAILVVAALLGGIGASVASEFDELGPTISDGIDDVETWLVEDSPFDIDRQRLNEIRSQGADRISEVVSSSGGAIASTATIAVEIVVGMLLALIVAFFMLKDREKMIGLGLRTVRADRREELRAIGARAWATLGGYLRGVAILGVVESIVIGAAVWLVGGRLVAAVVAVTLLGAFVPIVGAVVAGIVAVLVTLVTAGAPAALVVAVVALVVQQLDNDLLAPVIYGKSLQLHPLVILLGIAAGTALFGFVGTLLAVPVISVAINAVDEYRNPTLERRAPEPGG